jgi:hypothetical protein
MLVMAKDGDRHVLGDPVTRLARGISTAVLSDEPAGEFSDTELRRRLANTDMLIKEAPDRGTPAHLVGALMRRRDELFWEYRHRHLFPM